MDLDYAQLCTTRLAHSGDCLKCANFAGRFTEKGLLDTETLLTSKSKLLVSILDELHNNNIEVISPNVVASRPTDPNTQFIAKAKGSLMRRASTASLLAK